MGRHRRSEHQPPIRPRHPAGTGRPRGQHRKQSPARAGMLGTSAAVAVGALAMASGVLGNSYDLDRGNDPLDRVQAGDPPSSLPLPQGSSSAPSFEDFPSEDPGSESPSEDESAKPKPSPSTSAAPETSTKAPEPSAKSPSRTTEKPSTPSKAPSSPKPDRTSKAPSKPTDATTAAEAEVLRLVNQERAKAGCQPLTNNPELAKMAAEYSEDMAIRGYFDHTDPDGDDPWDRAQDYGITDLGGENIARGQANAQSVMDAWMASEGHRANILNCEFKTMGVGAHFADGGPWWTQNFGY